VVKPSPGPDQPTVYNDSPTGRISPAQVDLDYLDLAQLHKIEVPKSHSPLGPFWRTDPNDQTWGARPPTEAELETAQKRPEPRPPTRKKVCRGARPRASRGRPIRRRGSRRTSAPVRAGPSDDPDPEPPDELVPALSGRAG
jgi:hypothetical protein